MDAGDYSTLVARRAESERDLHAVARLRFDVYVAEHGRAYAGADHARKTLSDDLDADADIMLIEHMHAGIIATVRSNSLASTRARAHYGALFGLAAFDQIPHHDIVVCSRLAVSKEHRHSNVRAQLFEAVYLRRLALGTRFCFATSAPEHLEMFTHYGFREFAGPVKDSVGGLLHRIMLALDDVEHLERVDSPFATLARLLGLAERRQPRLVPIPDARIA